MSPHLPPPARPASAGAGRRPAPPAPRPPPLATAATRGERAADAVAALGGSWGFVGGFGLVLLAWVLLDRMLQHWRGHGFDPYPFILLNLFLSMLAAIQAPVILMSQNRQSQQDRLHAEHDYEVNRQAEQEISLLHRKVDGLVRQLRAARTASPAMRHRPPRPAHRSAARRARPSP